MSCAVKGCKSNSSRRANWDVKITFHQFPRDTNKKNGWIRRLNRPTNWTPNARSYICSKHFTADSFKVGTSKLRRLKPDAVPTLNLPRILEEKRERKSRMEMEVDKPKDPNPGVSTISNQNSIEMIVPMPRSFERRRKQRMPMAVDNSDPSPGSSTKNQNSIEVIAPMDEGRKGGLLLSENKMTSYYKKKIKVLENELQRIKIVSDKRFLKIDALRKQNSRLVKKNKELYTSMMDMLETQDIEQDHYITLDNIDNEYNRRFVYLDIETND